MNKEILRAKIRISGKGVHMYKGVGVCLLCWFYLVFLKYPIKMKYFGLTKTKLFHFQRIVKNGVGWGGVSLEPVEPPLDQSVDNFIDFESKDQCVISK